MFISPSLHLTKLSRRKFLKNLFSNCYVLQRVNVQTATNCCAYCKVILCKPHASTSFLRWQNYNVYFQCVRFFFGPFEAGLYKPVVGEHVPPFV